MFEWDQTLEEVNMYIELPKGVPTKLFRCTIQAGHVEVGIRGNPPYLITSTSVLDSVPLDYLLIDVFPFSPLDFVACHWGLMPFFGCFCSTTWRTP